MTVFFVAFDTDLSDGQLAARRRRLRNMLQKEGVQLKTFAVGEGRSIAQRVAGEARGAVVIVLDDRNAKPNESPWIRQLQDEVSDLTPSRRPQVIYVCSRVSGIGQAQVAAHPLVRHYIDRDSKDHWLKSVAISAARMARDMKSAEVSLPTPEVDGGDAIVGASACFREAVEELSRIIRLPYGMVSGEAGSGKLFLIQMLWKQLTAEPKVVVLSCGSFFKDYYVGTSRRRFGGGREGAGLLGSYLDEINNGLLILHHLERLPISLQEELIGRLGVLGDNDFKNPVVGVDNNGLSTCNVRIIATSTLPPADLRGRGLVEELAVKFAKRHVRIPCLSERGPSDIELICQDVLRRIVHQQAGDDLNWRKLVPQFGPSAMQLLRNAKCPDNISDLLRWIEYAWRHCRGGTIRRNHLPADILSGRKSGGTLDEIVADAQRAAIRSALDQSGNDMSTAAKILGRNKNALHRLMRNLGMKEATLDL